MDDYSINSLTESKNEWCAKLVSVFTPAIVQGMKSIFEEAWNLCEENEEEDKYLMTFQTFLSRVPKWNNTIIETERKRICDTAHCDYLEDLITCVHIIQLKALTCVRVGQHQKKIDIDIPSVDNFVHKVYINVARKIYTNVYLFEKGIPPLQIQKHNRELELIIKESILNTIRDTMPIQDILKAYVSETHEEEVDIQEEIIERPLSKDETDDKDIEKVSAEKEIVPKIDITTDLSNISVNVDASDTMLTPGSLTFSNVDKAQDDTGVERIIEAPKDIDTLEKKSTEAFERRKLEESEDEDEEEDDDEKLQIGEELKLDVSSFDDMNITKL